MYDENRLSYAPDFVETFFCGDSTSAKIELNSLLKRQICLFCNKEPKSIKEISKALGMAEEYIEEAVVSLLKLKLLKNEGRKLITNFCMLPLNISRKAAALKHNYLVDSLFAERINKALYENKSEIMKIVSNSVNDFTFENLLWILYSLFASAVNVRIKDYFPRRQAVKFNINDSYLFPDEYSFSVRADYRFADEKENEEDAALVDYRRGHSSKFLSVKTADFGECHFCRVYELSKEITDDEEVERLKKGDIDAGYLSLLLSIAENPDYELNPHELKSAGVLEKAGFIIKQAEKYKCTLPVFRSKELSSLYKLLAEIAVPFAAELYEKIGRPLEAVLLPHIRKDEELLNQFYCFWLSSYTSPDEELYQYGIKNGILTVPEEPLCNTVATYLVH